MIRTLERNAVELALRVAEPMRAARRAAGGLRRRVRSLAQGDTASRPLRVLVEVDTLDRGGLEQAVRDLVANLDRERFEPVVACVRSGGETAERLRAAGERVEILDGREGAYRALLERERFDLVNSHYSTFGAKLVSRSGIPHVHVIHNSYVWLDDGGARRLAWRLRDIGHFVAVSSTVASWAQRRLHVPGWRLEIIPNGIDARGLERPGRNAAREELNIKAEDFVFLLVGSYEPRKGHRALLRAFAEVAKEHSQAMLICAGNSPVPGFLDECRAQVGSRKLESRVRLLDYQASAGRLYSAADAFVLPSVVEGFSLSALEAASCGLPLILTDVGGARDLLERHSLGILVPGYLDDLAEASPRELNRAYDEPPQRVVDALAEAMSQVCAKPDHWREVGAAGREIVSREYDVRAVVRRYEQCFVAALG